MHLISENIHHAHQKAMIFSILVALLGFIIAFIRYYLKRDILESNDKYDDAEKLVDKSIKLQDDILREHNSQFNDVFV